MRSVLQFSGGKDSLATLLLLEKEVKSGEIVVAWANTGDAFPETLEQMQKVKEFCHTFIEVKGFQSEVIRDFGLPSDLVPSESHVFTQNAFSIKDKVKIQSGVECCIRSHMMPMDEFVKANGFNRVYRGQKKSDTLKGGLFSGDIIDGVEYIYPIESWTDDDVYAYIKDSDLLSEHYKVANTSMDCMHCTAFLNENIWKSDYLKQHHSNAYIETQKRFKTIYNAVQQDLQNLNKVIGA